MKKRIRGKAVSPKSAKRSGGKKLTTWQKDIIAGSVLFFMVFFLFNDLIVNDKVFSVGGDSSTAVSFHQYTKDAYDETGEFPLWNPAIFAGIPGFAAMAHNNRSLIPFQNIVIYTDPLTYVNMLMRVLFWNRGNAWEFVMFFLGAMFTYILGRSLGFGPGVAMIGAVAYAFCNFFIGSEMAGHGGKVKTMMFLPFVLFSVIRFFITRDLFSWTLVAFSIGMLFAKSSHTQVVYYGLLAIGLYALIELIYGFKSERKTVLMVGLGLVGAILVGFASGTLQYISTYVYSAFSIRGTSPAFAEVQSGGLDFDYITAWSFPPSEILTFFIPSFFGLEGGIYWGDQPFVASSYYFGLLPVLAAGVGIIYRRNKFSIFFATMAVLSLLMSLGKYFEPFFELLLSVLPFFNKFRTPTMVLCLFVLSVSMLGMYGVDFILNPSDAEKEKHKRFARILVWVLGVFAALLLIFFLAKNGMRSSLVEDSLLKEGDAARYNLQTLNNLKQIRFDRFYEGLIRFSILGAIFAGIALVTIRKKIGAGLGVSLLVLVSFADVTIVNREVLKPQPARIEKGFFKETETIRFLRQDASRYRIFPVSESLTSPQPSWLYYGFHNLTGYSPAKPRIVQDILDYALLKGPDQNFPLNRNVLNMLNVKYLIANGRIPDGLGFEMAYFDQEGKSVVYRNVNALPRAYLVGSTETPADTKAMFGRINSTKWDPSRSALLEKEMNFEIEEPDSSTVDITRYEPNRVEVQVYTDKSALLVLADTYYPAGWKAFVDGTETEILKTNYLVRSVPVPAGSHTVSFVFDPLDYRIGLWVSTIVNLVLNGLLIFCLVRLFLESRQRSMKERA